METPILKDVVVDVTTDGITVTPIWEGVDRPDTYSWGLKPTHKTLAERLVRAIRAGKVFTNLAVIKDVNQKTYVFGNCRVMGRRLSADLKRLGF